MSDSGKPKLYYMRRPESLPNAPLFSPDAMDGAPTRPPNGYFIRDDLGEYHEVVCVLEDYEIVDLTGDTADKGEAE